MMKISGYLNYRFQDQGGDQSYGRKNAKRHRERRFCPVHRPDNSGTFAGTPFGKYLKIYFISFLTYLYYNLPLNSNSVLGVDQPVDQSC